ncbi:MAG: NlpC/P60 family protein [Intestinibacter sp.]
MKFLRFSFKIFNAMPIFAISFFTVLLFNAIILPNNLIYAQANCAQNSTEIHAINISFDDDKASSLANDLNKNFKNIDGRYYYFKGGKVQYGMLNIENDTYYMHPKKGYLLNGLQSIGDKIYYFDQNTYKMKKNSSITISNLCFSFDQKGVCTSIKATSDDKRTKLLEEAFKKIGTPYGNKEGELRCNTFASDIYSKIGINYLQDKKSYEQAKICLNLGCNIKEDKLKPGDLIFFNNYKCKKGKDCPRIDGIYHIHHVAIYVAPGILIESTSTVANGYPGVRVTNFDPDRPRLSRCPILYANLIDGISKDK